MRVSAGKCFSLARRDELRALIGERAEELAYANCVMERASLGEARASARRTPTVSPDGCARARASVRAMCARADSHLPRLVGVLSASGGRIDGVRTLDAWRVALRPELHAEAGTDSFVFSTERLVDLLRLHMSDFLDNVAECAGPACRPCSRCRAVRALGARANPNTVQTIWKALAPGAQLQAARPAPPPRPRARRYSFWDYRRAAYVAMADALRLVGDADVGARGPLGRRTHESTRSRHRSVS